MTTQSTRAFKGVGINNETLSDTQMGHFERSYVGIVACRGKFLSDAYILFVTASDETPPVIPGIQFTELVPAENSLGVE